MPCSIVIIAHGSGFVKHFQENFFRVLYVAQQLGGLVLAKAIVADCRCKSDNLHKDYQLVNASKTYNVAKSNRVSVKKKEKFRRAAINLNQSVPHRLCTNAQKQAVESQSEIFKKARRSI